MLLEFSNNTIKILYTSELESHFSGTSKAEILAKKTKSDTNRTKESSSSNHLLFYFIF